MPFAGNSGKLAPHPASDGASATFPPQGGEGILYFPFHQYNTENAPCVLQSKYKKSGMYRTFGTSHKFYGNYSAFCPSSFTSSLSAKATAL